MNDIKVSVPVICYKHAKYIRKCLDGILMQKVNFKYEIVVGEDCSEDGTKEILLEYKEKYPDIFVLLLNEENLGPTRNNLNVRRHCRGKYLSGCEGDDFWIDEYKLQKQVDFLDSHPEYSAVATNSVSVDANGMNPKISLLPYKTNKIYTLKNYLSNGMTIHGNTLMMRAHLLKHDEKYVKLRLAEPTMGDIITRVVLYDKGPIFLLPDVTHAHRSGEANSTSYSYQQSTKLLFYTKMCFRIVDNLTNYFNHKYNLEALKSNRMSLVLFCVITRQYKVEWNEFIEVWRMLSPRYRLLTCYKTIKRFVKKIFNLIYRKLIFKNQLR